MLNGACWGCGGIWLGCLPEASLLRYSGHVWLGGSPGAPGEIMYGLGMPQVPLHKAWSTRMGKMMPELLLLVCCQWSQNPDMLIDTCKGRCRWKSENASRILSFVKLWLSYGKQQWGATPWGHTRLRHFSKCYCLEKSLNSSCICNT